MSSRFPLDLTLDGQPIRVTAVRPDATVYHRLVSRDGQLVRDSDDIPGPGFVLADDTTDEQIATHLATPVTPTPLTVEQVWQQKLAGTFTVEGPDGPIQLKTSLSAANRFTSMEALLKSGLDQGKIANDTMVEIWDANNVSHPVTVAQARSILFDYGLLWMAMFNEFAP